MPDTNVEPIFTAEMMERSRHLFEDAGVDMRRLTALLEQQMALYPELYGLMADEEVDTINTTWIEDGVQGSGAEGYAEDMPNWLGTASVGDLLGDEDGPHLSERLDLVEQIIDRALDGDAAADELEIGLTHSLADYLHMDDLPDIIPDHDNWIGRNRERIRQWFRTEVAARRRSGSVAIVGPSVPTQDDIYRTRQLVQRELEFQAGPNGEGRELLALTALPPARVGLFQQMVDDGLMPDPDEQICDVDGPEPTHIALIDETGNAVWKQDLVAVCPTLDHGTWFWDAADMHWPGVVGTFKGYVLYFEDGSE